MEKIKNKKKYDVKTYQNRFFKKMRALGKKRVGFWLTATEEVAVKKLLENFKKSQENDMAAQNDTQETELDDTYETEAAALIAAIKEYKAKHQERGEGFSANIYQDAEAKKFAAEVSFSADTRMTVWYENEDEFVDELWENPDSKESLQGLVEIAIIAEQEGYIRNI